MAKYDASLQPGAPAPTSSGGAPSGRLVYTDSGPKMEYDTPSGPSFAPPTAQTAPLPMPDRADFTTMSDPDKWTATTELTPEAQEIFDLEMQGTKGSAQLGLMAMGQMGDTFADPFTIEGQAPTYQGPQGQMPTYGGPQGPMPGFQGPEGDMPKYGEHRQGVMDAMMSRVNTDIGRDRERVSSQLIAQGIPPGSEAYNRQMEQLDRKQTDARQQAEISAEGMAGMGYESALAGRGMESQEGMNDFLTAMQARGMTKDEALATYKAKMTGREMTSREGMDVYNTDLKSWQQNIQDDVLRRTQPLNEYNTLNSGQQMGMPSYQGYQSTPYIGGPDITNAGRSQYGEQWAGYNSDIAQDNALKKGLFDTGAAWLGTR